MSELGEYVLSLSCAALISGILYGLVEDNFGKELVKLLGGIFLTITVLTPLLRTDFSVVSKSFLSFSEEAAQNSTYGQEMAEAAVSEIIKRETEAYILEKAAALQAELTADVTVESGIPQRVLLTGNISPYSKIRLISILETELGIPKENQVWT